MTDPRDNHEGFEIFDAVIVAEESNPDPIFDLLWDLKAGEGGLGIPRLNGGKSKKACPSVRKAC